MKCISPTSKKEKESKVSVSSILVLDTGELGSLGSTQKGGKQKQSWLNKKQSNKGNGSTHKHTPII